MDRIWDWPHWPWGLRSPRASSTLRSPLPLLIGTLASAVLAGRAFFRRLALSDRLLLDRDAYAIPEIRRRGEDMASMENRRALAQAVRAG